MHIVASPREDESRTLQISEAFLQSFQETHEDWVFDELNLAKEELPSLNARRLDGKYMLLKGKDLSGVAKAAWREIVQHIERFSTADLYLISAPMWNFSIPYMLKHYIDLIVQPNYLFRYRKGGTTKGFLQGKKMVVVATRGAQYQGAMQALDFQVPYLRAIFGFVGITDIVYVTAEPTDMGMTLCEQTLQQAKATARELARSL